MKIVEEPNTFGYVQLQHFCRRVQRVDISSSLTDVLCFCLKGWTIPFWLREADYSLEWSHIQCLVNSHCHSSFHVCRWWWPKVIKGLNVHQLITELTPHKYTNVFLQALHIFIGLLESASVWQSQRKYLMSHFKFMRYLIIVGFMYIKSVWGKKWLQGIYLPGLLQV